MNKAKIKIVSTFNDLNQETFKTINTNVDAFVSSITDVKDGTN
jgi:hypothetical protein